MRENVTHIFFKKEDQLATGKAGELRGSFIRKYLQINHVRLHINY